MTTFYRLKPPAKENPPTEDQDSTRETSEDPAATAPSDVHGQGARKDEGDGTDIGGDTDDEQTFSEWRVHPRVTPRKDMALQVKSGLDNVS